MPLLFAPIEKPLRVTHISGDEKLRGHLSSLGIVLEGIISLLSVQGSGAILKVKDSRLALDHDVCSHIQVAVI